VRAAALVRDVDQLVVWARDLDKAKAFAARVGAKLGVPATALASAGECVAAAELVITTTPSAVPLFGPESLHAGLHITAMGSDAAGKNEIDPKVIAAADRVVCDRRAQSEALGELRAAIAAGVVADTCEVDELGEICAGLKPGRRSDQDITVCDLTGTGVQDTAIAAHARACAAARGLGTIIVS
jgi:ornithine cyclodeaminase